MTRNPIYCERCCLMQYMTPRGDCPGCGTLLTLFPGIHMRPAPDKQISPEDQAELYRFEQYLEALSQIEEPTPDHRATLYELYYGNN